MSLIFSKILFYNKILEVKKSKQYKRISHKANNCHGRKNEGGERYQWFQTGKFFSKW